MLHTRSIWWFWRKIFLKVFLLLCQSFGEVSPYVCSYYFKFGLVAEWPPFGKELLTLLTICSRRTLTICNY